MRILFSGKVYYLVNYVTYILKPTYLNQNADFQLLSKKKSVHPSNIAQKPVYLGKEGYQTTDLSDF